MADRAHALADEEIAKIQRHIAGIYRAAKKDVAAELREYAKPTRKKADKLLQAVNDAENSDARKAAENAYKRFFLVDVKRDKRFNEAVQKAAERLYKANTDAAKYINSKTAHVYAENYNQTGKSLQSDLDGYNFKPVSDEEAEKYGQITRQVIDEEKDTAWNTENIVSAIIAGVLILYGIDKIIENAIEKVIEKNNDSGDRQANDMLTDAESKGRLDSMYRASDEGWNIKKQWICIYDNRTRDTHIQYNDIGAVNLDYEFAPGLKRPRDKKCSIMAEVCNCRCALTQVTGKAQENTRAARRGDVIGSYKKPSSFKGTETEYISEMTYREWMKWRSQLQ